MEECEQRGDKKEIGLIHLAKIGSVRTLGKNKDSLIWGVCGFWWFCLFVFGFFWVFLSCFVLF